MASNFPNKDFLILEIDPKIVSFQNKASLRRARSLSVSISVAVLAAASAILLGLKIKEWEESVRIIAIILTGIISILNLILSIFKDKQLWVVYNNASNSLKALKLKINAETITTDIDQTKVSLYTKELQKILDDTNKGWTENNKG